MLKDYRAFRTNFGGARPLDEQHVSGAAYGPAGMVLAGAGFKRSDVGMLTKSYRKLNAALHVLRREHFQEWGALIEPYLSDVADHSVIEDWRQKLQALDEENAGVRQENVKRAEKGRSEKPEKVALVIPRLQLERHDRAIRRLAGYLKGEKLHVVNPKLMSTREVEAGEAANAQIYAYFQQVRVSGRTERGAVSAAAWKFGVSEDEIERVIEFRSENKLASCVMVECGRKVFSQNLCQRHYQAEWRTKTKKVS